MEIQLASFALGIVSVLLIAMVIGGVYAVVKVVRMKNDLNGLNIYVAHEFDSIRKTIETKDTDLDHKIGNIYRDIDSRLDKLYDKILKEIAPNRKFLQMISNPPVRSIQTEEKEEKPPFPDGSVIKKIMDKVDKIS